jgi:cell division protein YceG involved in septum cleavage
VKRLLLLAVLVLTAWFAYSEIAGSGDATTSSERVVIPKGASMRAAAESLAVHNVIGSTRLFRWYTAAAGRERILKPGTYQFPSGAG